MSNEGIPKIKKDGYINEKGEFIRGGVASEQEKVTSGEIKKKVEKTAEPEVSILGARRLTNGIETIKPDKKGILDRLREGSK